MWQGIKDFLTYLENGFSNYPFLKDVVIATLGVVFGGIVTVIINRGAIRKQAHFNMKYDILKEETNHVNELANKVEMIEIALSFNQTTLSDLSNDIEALESSLLHLNFDLEEKRKFVVKYITAMMVEHSAQYVLDYKNVFYKQGNGGAFDYQLKDKLTSENITDLRALTNNLKSLANKLTEGKESLIAPGLFSKLLRKLRSVRIKLSKLWAIGKISRENK